MHSSCLCRTQSLFYLALPCSRSCRAVSKLAVLAKATPGVRCHVTIWPRWFITQNSDPYWVTHRLSKFLDGPIFPENKVKWLPWQCSMWELVCNDFIWTMINVYKQLITKYISTHTCRNKRVVTTQPCLLTVYWSELCVACVEFLFTSKIKHETSSNWMPWWITRWTFCFPFHIRWKCRTFFHSMEVFKLIKMWLSFPVYWLQNCIFIILCVSLMLIPEDTIPTITSMNCLENPVLCHKQNGTAMCCSGICSKIFGLYPTFSCPLLHLYILVIWSHLCHESYLALGALWTHLSTHVWLQWLSIFTGRT